MSAAGALADGSMIDEPADGVSELVTRSEPIIRFADRAGRTGPRAGTHWPAFNAVLRMPPVAALPPEIRSG